MIPVNEPLLDGNERRYVTECIDSGWISSEGPFVERFERELAGRVERRHGIAVCNGTAALELAIAGLGLQPGDEVLMPTFTIISCAAAVIRRGCVPVLVDSDSKTWNMDVNQLEGRITPKTRAVMVVHIYGLPVDMDAIARVARKHGLLVIEDASQMLGQTFRGQPCGSFGDISTFSFYPNKHITTGEGGMVLTNDEGLAARCRSLRNLCFSSRRFIHEELGYNFRMSNLQAALGVAQLERLDEFVARKRQMGNLYSRLLSDLDCLEMMPLSTNYAENIFWVFGAVLHDSVPFEASEAMARLGSRQIATRPFFWPMHEQPVFRNMGLFGGERYPVAERLARRGFYIPSGMALQKAQMEMVVTAVKELFSADNYQPTRAI
ncbi:Glutamine--scyllo-inositol transaminase [Desulfurispirillum indicum S5]|uniref:Glutamine--scyllo-inositol transaminase n=1 Tax=Desulfurispirillum indicum (strain ATCC BAA-1389 / DSM 22839 / S5) TaxID=653733 RepID=E6W5A9_DESIS|nr:DegT/DnrJ/EryC1/StrS family aminotransferase [Desulfurispirillum indicum]ADU67188.1 Glutamine--scyllo-inositol transaminase [Desulfurispirillum indicum S5]